MKKQIWLGVTLLAAVVMALPAMAKGISAAEISAAAGQKARSQQQSLEKQLCKAAEKGNVSRIHELVGEKGVYVDAGCGTSGSKTPLMNALDNGHYEAARVLLEEYHANPKAKNRHNWTVLMYAVFSKAGEPNNVVMLKALDEHGRVDLDNIKKNIGRMVDLVLAQPGVKEDEEYLNIGAGKDRRTALGFAVRSAYDLNYPELIRKLVDVPAIDVNKSYASGWTPLHQAINHQDVDTVRILLTREDIDVNVPCPDGPTPLSLAKKKGNKEIVRMLKAKGATE